MKKLPQIKRRNLAIAGVVCLIIGGAAALVMPHPAQSPGRTTLRTASPATSPSPSPLSPSPTVAKPSVTALPTGLALGAAIQAVGGKPLSDWSLFVDPTESSAKEQANAWRSTRPADAARMDKMASRAQSKWIGDWFPDPYQETNRYISDATRAGKLPVLTLYSLPSRDCGLYSKGGAASDQVYLSWLARAVQAMGQRPVIVIVEPDALAELTCYSTAQQNSIYRLLSNAVTSLRVDKNALIYLDAGDAQWQSPATMASRLRAAGVDRAAGFSVNVSSFWTTPESLVYAKQISALVGGKHFVVDTSRNGAGHPGTWCNPPGRALGQPPTLHTGEALADGYLWVKIPGESDGECDRDEPAPGIWWPEYALGLAVKAGY